MNSSSAKYSLRKNHAPVSDIHLLSDEVAIKTKNKAHPLIGQDFKDEARNTRYVVINFISKEKGGTEEDCFIARATSARIGDTTRDLKLTLSELEEKVGTKLAESHVSESPVTRRSYL